MQEQQKKDENKLAQEEKKKFGESEKEVSQLATASNTLYNSKSILFVHSFTFGFRHFF